MTYVFADKDDSKTPSDDQQLHMTDDTVATRHVHVVVLGTGFSGLGMAIQLKKRGYNDFVVLEKASGLGGTWRDNTYPGCACDIPSNLYSFSFAQNPHWSRMYPPQHEIQEYLYHCAENFGILPYIRWKCELLDATWDQTKLCWYITTTQGKLTATILILGNGPLSEPSLPTIPGIESFKGMLFHSARWKHDTDLAGKRVAVIGTGASAIQFIPHIQPQVAHLTLFQRTPPWIVPRQDHPISVRQHTLFRMFPILQRLERIKLYWQHEITALGMIYQPKMLQTGMKIAQNHLLKQVPDPILRAKLTPQYMIGCKRILLSDDFYPALSRPNVAVVTEHIRAIQAQSIVTEDGQEHEVDTIICGTGFHVTDTQLPQRIYGKDGQSLIDSWRAGINAYLGTTVAGFPNLFLLIGPNTGLGHNSMVFMIESQLNYILDCLRLMKQRNLPAIEIQSQIQETFNLEIQRRMQGTVWTSGCTSWYLDAAKRNTTIWPGFTFEFRQRTRHFDPQHYTIFQRELSSAVENATSNATIPK